MLRIRELRLQKKILQKDMAKELGIPANTFNQYEKGRREPDLSTLSRIDFKSKNDGTWKLPGLTTARRRRCADSGGISRSGR